ncbi:MAG TPA: hypothetical protein VGB55_16065, partial [Tepidisphaeraceae bacterium]
LNGGMHASIFVKVWGDAGGGDKGRTALAQYAYDLGKKSAATWTCFHCSESFDDAEKARLHFGATERQEPACQIDIAKYREMEQRMEAYNAEDAEIHQQMHGLQSTHATELRRAEEIGYARALNDTGYRDLTSPEFPDDLADQARTTKMASADLPVLSTLELCAWLREHSSGAYRPSENAANLIEQQDRIIMGLRRARQLGLVHPDFSAAKNLLGKALIDLRNNCKDDFLVRRVSNPITSVIALLPSNEPQQLDSPPAAPPGWSMTAHGDGWIFFKRPDDMRATIAPGEALGSHGDTLYMLMSAFAQAPTKNLVGDAQ